MESFFEKIFRFFSYIVGSIWFVITVTITFDLFIDYEIDSFPLLVDFVFSYLVLVGVNVAAAICIAFPNWVSYNYSPRSSNFFEPIFTSAVYSLVGYGIIFFQLLASMMFTNFN